MANIHDPETWGKYDEKTKLTLYKIKELFFDDVSEQKEQEEKNNDL